MTTLLPPDVVHPEAERGPRQPRPVRNPPVERQIAHQVRSNTGATISLGGRLWLLRDRKHVLPTARHAQPKEA